jgi:hypothetical protein
MLPSMTRARLLLVAALAGACSPDPRGPAGDDGPPATTDDTLGPGTHAPADSSGEPVDAAWRCPDEPAPWFVLGWDYKDGWLDLQPGGPLTITLGGQGLWMIPLGVHASGFCVPADPFAYDLVPTLDIAITAAGHPEPIATVVGFPVSFVPLDEDDPGSLLGYTFIPMILADALDVDALEGVPATIHAELLPRDAPRLVFDHAGVLTISD